MHLSKEILKARSSEVGDFSQFLSKHYAKDSQEAIKLFEGLISTPFHMQYQPMKQALILLNEDYLAVSSLNDVGGAFNHVITTQYSSWQPLLTLMIQKYHQELVVNSQFHSIGHTPLNRLMEALCEWRLEPRHPTLVKAIELCFELKTDIDSYSVEHKGVPAKFELNHLYRNWIAKAVSQASDAHFVARKPKGGL